MFDPPDWAGRAALGFEPEDFGDERFAVWPENLLAVDVFSAMCHQWRSSMNGYYGLDMNVLPIYEERMGVPLDKRSEVFEALHVMERAVLQFLQSKRPPT